MNNFIEHDEFIKLQEKYRLLLLTTEALQDRYDRLFHYMNDKYPDELDDFFQEEIK